MWWRCERYNRPCQSFVKTRSPVIGSPFQREDRSVPNEFARGRPRPDPQVCVRSVQAEELTPSEVLRFSDDRGWRLRVIPNLYPALTPQSGGIHEVIIDSPLHVSSFGQLPASAAQDLLLAAQARIRAFSHDPQFQYAQFFKNNGPGSGASMEHPHSQLLAVPHVPGQVRLEVERSQEYFNTHGRCAFCDLPAAAQEDGRIVFEDENAIVMAPYAPRFTFETWILPRQHLSRFEDADPDTLRAAGSALHATLGAIETLYARPPYNFLLHTFALPLRCIRLLPLAHRNPPRMGGIGGFEFGTGYYINTVSPEKAAARLRQLVSR